MSRSIMLRCEHGTDHRPQRTTRNVEHVMEPGRPDDVGLEPRQDLRPDRRRVSDRPPRRRSGDAG